jgi:O-antigen/teichoic acid export membrane protein
VAIESEKQSQKPARAPRNLLFARAFQVGSGQVIRRCTRFLFFFFAARKLGPTTFGVYALLLAILLALAMISGEGFSDYLARELSKAPESGRGLYVRVIQLRLLYGALLFVPALVLLHALKYPAEILVDGALLFLVLFPNAPLGAAQGVLRAAGRFGLLTWLETVQGLVLLVTGVALFAKAPNLRSIIWAEVASASAGGIASLLMVCGLPQIKSRSVVAWRQVLRETSVFNIYPVIANIYDRIDVVLLSALAGSFAVGIYAAPYRVLNALQVLPFALMSALLPAISGITPNGNDQQLCSRMTGFFYSLALFPVLAVTLLARPLVLILLGNSFADSTPVLRILIWASIPMFVNFGLNTFLLARGHEKKFLRTTLVCAAVNIVANLILIPRFSYFAAAAVTILTEVVLLVQNVIIIHSLRGFFPVPDKFWQTSGIFLFLLVLGLWGNVYTASLWPASAAFLVFAGYFYVTGYMHSVLRWTRLGAFTG